MWVVFIKACHLNRNLILNIFDRSKVLQQITLLLVLSVTLGSAQLCIFRFDENGYNCELLQGTYLNRGDPFVISGNHLAGFQDVNVTELHKSLTFPPVMRFIPETIFQRFPNLRIVNLSNGNIESVAGIPNCAVLERFIINENNVLDAAGLSQCTNLRYISMVSNAITSVNSADFQNLNQLTELSLVNNNINRLNALNIPNLQILNVGLNQISAIPSNFFANLPSLQQFNTVGNLCASRMFFPQTDADLNQALAQCFQNYDGGVTDPTTILPETPSPPTVDPETTAPTTVLPETPSPPTLDPGTPAPETEPPTTIPGTPAPETDAPTTQAPPGDGTDDTTLAGSLLESKTQLTFSLLLLVLVISKVIAWFWKWIKIGEKYFNQ